MLNEVKDFYAKNVAPGADRTNTDAADVQVAAAAASSTGGDRHGGDRAGSKPAKGEEERKYMTELLQHDSTRFDPAVRRLTHALWEGIRERFGTEKLNLHQYMTVFLQISKSLADSDDESSDGGGGSGGSGTERDNVHTYGNANEHTIDAATEETLERGEARCAKKNAKEDAIHAAIMADWEFDSGGKGYVTKNDFIESVMQLTASWVEAPSARRRSAKHLSDWTYSSSLLVYVINACQILIPFYAFLSTIF